jgi:acetoacetyl-CoA synthetase
VAEAGTVLWTPPAGRVRESHWSRFRAYASRRAGWPLDDDALYAWSVAEPAAFWAAVADFGVVRFTRLPRTVLEHGDRFPGARWFPGGELNFAWHLLRFTGPQPALVGWTEAGQRTAISRDELRDRVLRLAAGLKAWGLCPGDRVAACLPNTPDTVVAMLACTALGAVWSSCSPDFGLAGLASRFGPIAPRLLFATDGYGYGGKDIDCVPVATALAAELGVPIVWVPRDPDGPMPDAVPSALDFRQLCGGRLPPDPETLFASLPFDHPLCILYSSGTTGAPKAIVHGAGGTLVQHLKELLLHTDLRAGDPFFYYTTCGWMMWNWLVSGLAVGATLTLYEGSPFHPDPGVLWRIAERERLAVFGTSARYLASLRQSGYRPREAVRLDALRTVLSTGSPLAPEGFDFVYEAIKPDVQLASISGGTDIVSCFVLGQPTRPVRRGEIQGPGLGMAVDVFDADGRPLPSGTGELVCTGPFPSVPLGFWGDADERRFHASYFARFPGVWTHGDFAERTPSGGFIIHGRSDAVLNPGGVRIGTAELYAVVEAEAGVGECLAVAQRRGADERIVLFVVPAPGVTVDDALQTRLRARIRAALTPRHVPAVIAGVTELPRTRNGKLAELAVRAVVHGEVVANRDALMNPECLAQFAGRPELEA